MAQKDISGNNLSDKLELEINFKGNEFDNFVEITRLNRKLSAINNLIKSSVKTLKETKKIKEQKDIIESIQVDLKRNSLDNVILINFTLPLLSTIVGGLIVEYIKYLANKNKEEEYKKEIKILNKDISVLNHIEKLIEIRDIHSNIEIKVENNLFNISNEENLNIKKKINELKKEVEYKEVEETFIGRIEKIDCSENKQKLFFTEKNSDKKIPIYFENDITEDEIRSIILRRLKIDGIATYKNNNLEKIVVLNYEDAEPKTINSYLKDKNEK